MVVCCCRELWLKILMFGEIIGFMLCFLLCCCMILVSF